MNIKTVLFDGNNVRDVSLRDVSLPQWTPPWMTTSDQFTAAAAHGAVPWLHRCVQMRAATISALPFAITQDGEEVDFALSNQLPALLYLAEAGLCLYGRAYWFVQRLGKRLIGLRWAHPDTIQPRYDEQRGLVGFTRQLASKQIDLDLEQLVYFWEPNPVGELGPGPSLAQVALAAAGLAKNANDYISGFFQRGAIPAVILSVEGNPPPEELKRLETWWKRLLGGVKRAWETVALRASVKPTIVGGQLADLDLEPIFAAARQQIAVTFGIPQTMLEDAANFATAKEHKLSFYYETIFPEAKHIEATLNEQLFGPAGLEFGWQFDQVEAVQQDEATKAQAVVQLFTAGIISGAEAREQLGFEVRQPAAQAEAETMALPKAVFAELGKWRRKLRRGGKTAFESEVIPPWLRQAIEWRLSQDAYRDIAIDPCVKSLDRGKAENKLAKKLTSVLQGALPGFQKEVAKGDIPDMAELTTQLSAVLNVELTNTVADELLALATEVGVGLDYAQVVTDAAAWAQQYSYELVKGITDTSKAFLQDVTKRLANGGLDKDAAVAMLEPLFGPVRAEAIAVTEITRALSQAEAMYAKELAERDLELQERWLTAEDEKVCPICGALDHTLKDKWGQEFPDGPPAHPNCRCQVVLERVK